MVAQDARITTLCKTKGVSEFIAIMIVLVIAIVSTLIYFFFVGGVMGTSVPKLKYLDASVTGIEVLHSGSITEVSIGSTTFRASYVYRVDVILRNIGNKMISGLTYTTINLPGPLTVCTNDSCDIYDPVEFTTRYTNLPREIGPNQAIEISFIVLSKRNLLGLGFSPFLIKITGQLPDGSSVLTYVSLTGERS